MILKYRFIDVESHFLITYEKNVTCCHYTIISVNIKVHHKNFANITVHTPQISEYNVVKDLGSRWLSAAIEPPRVFTINDFEWEYMDETPHFLGRTTF